MKHFLHIFLGIGAFIIIFFPLYGQTVYSQTGEYKNPLGMTFVEIPELPAGKFVMGSPEDEPGRDSDEDPHVVDVPKEFYLQTTEVTQAQWQAIMKYNPSVFTRCGPDCPVENVSWNEIEDFIEELDEQGYGKYELPTEVQWEYAARAGSETAIANGDVTKSDECVPNEDLGIMGWYCANSGSTPHPVAQKDANDWGLYDMHGNVSEWVAGWYGDYPLEEDVLSGRAGSGFLRVHRGGSFQSRAHHCRSAFRSANTPRYADRSTGFRLLFKGDPDNPCDYDFSSTDSGFSENTETISVPDDGKTVTILVEAVQNTPCSNRESIWGAWKLSENDGWLTLDKSIERGGGTVSLTIEENSGEKRDTDIFIAGRTFTIEQDGFETCQYTISPNENISVPPGGDKIEVTVTTSAKCDWEVSKPEDITWLRFEPVRPGGTGEGAFFVQISPNIEGASRSEDIKVAGEILTITQPDQESCLYEISLSRKTFTATGTSSPVTITSPTDCPWPSIDTPDWILITQRGSTNDGNALITVEPNQEPEQRSAEITIHDEKFSITQEAVPEDGLTKTQVSRLYAAIFNRASEGSGNAFWRSFENTATAASEMLATDDARAYFNDSLETDQGFIAQIYENTLGKSIEDDSEGIAFWVEQLEGGTGRGQIVAELVQAIDAFGPSGEKYNPNDANAIAAYTRFTNRVTVSDYMADKLQNPPANYAQSTAFDQGLVVTDNADTVISAKTTVDELETLDPGDDDPGDDDPGDDDPGDDDPGDDDPGDDDPGDEHTHTNEFGMIFKKVTAGTFQMGSPVTELGHDYDETLQEKTIEQEFFIQTTEMTQEQWQAVMGSNPSYFDDCGGDCPVENVSWTDVQDFIARLNDRGTGTYRLPTEAEWEYAARAGTITPFSRDNVDEQKQHCDYDPVLNGLMWYCANSEQKTHPVGQKNRNKLGLDDMHGNVSEWVSDLYPEPPEDYAIIRGGSWRSFAHECRSAARDSRWMDYKAPDIGFRLIYEPAVDSSLE